MVFCKVLIEQVIQWEEGIVNNQERIYFDQGFAFGMGVFETIAVEQGCPLFLPWHLERMEKGLDTLDIDKSNFLEQVTKEKIVKYLQKNPMNHGALKIMVSDKNIIFNTRENPYTREDYERGFHLGISKVLRNETSLFTYVKSFHYGDNLLEKRKCKKAGYDEVLLLNTKGQITETTASNIFFVKNKRLFTPKTECGLLEGVVRRYVIENFDVQETVITKENLVEYEEVFLTNSIMGIMPVIGIEEKKFKSREVVNQLTRAYKNL